MIFDVKRLPGKSKLEYIIKLFDGITLNNAPRTEYRSTCQFLKNVYTLQMLS